MSSEFEITSNIGSEAGPIASNLASNVVSNIQVASDISTDTSHVCDIPSDILDILENGRPKIEIPYRNRLKVLAPMVRVGQLPFRELCQSFGADVVFTEELVDRALLKTTRHVNKKLGIVEYLDEKNQPVFQSSPHERNLVLQLGTPSAEQGLQAALHTYKDYDYIDLNCGCPKNFSTKGLMGAALLRPDSRERLKDILTTLTRNIDKPVTCKIRLLNRIEDTIDLVKMIESTGVHAITIHARYIPQRPREPAHLDQLALLKEHMTVPLIANGDCFTYQDIERMYEITKCDSVMIARGALFNASVFQPYAIPPCEVALEFIRRSEQYGCKFGYVKYALKRMFEIEPKKYPHTLLVNKIDHYSQLYDIFDDWENKILDQPRKRARLEDEPSTSIEVAESSA